MAPNPDPGPTRRPSDARASQQTAPSVRSTLIHALRIDLRRVLALDDAGPAELREGLRQAVEVVEARLRDRLLSRISDSGDVDLDGLLSAGRDVDAFLRERIPDLDEVTKQVLSQFKLDWDLWWGRRADREAGSDR